MSDDPFSTYDAPYVLGALPPDDRAAFEAHLRGCDRCTQAVNELAGLPGLLARAEIDDPVSSEPQPDLLPGLLFTVRRERRRRRQVTASGWVVAAACAIAIAVLALAPPSSPAPAAPLADMTAADGVEVAGQASLTGVAWGTKIEVRCTYPDDYPAPGTYVLAVVDRDGQVQRVGSWKVLPGRTSTLSASTDIAATDIGQVRVLSASDQTVLSLDH